MCTVDPLGRAGRLDEAKEMLRTVIVSEGARRGIDILAVLQAPWGHRQDEGGVEASCKHHGGNRMLQLPCRIRFCVCALGNTMEKQGQVDECE